MAFIGNAALPEGFALLVEPRSQVRVVGENSKVRRYARFAGGIPPD